MGSGSGIRGGTPRGRGTGLGEAGQVTAYAAVVLIVLAAVALGAIGVLVATEDTAETTLATSSTSTAGRPATTGACGSGTDARAGACGPGQEGPPASQRRDTERFAFAGDLAVAVELADRARAALESLVGAYPDPTADQVRAALAPVDPDAAVSSDAEGTTGRAFGIALAGGCVYGLVGGGTVQVDVGGYVKVGGCLAS